MVYTSRYDSVMIASYDTTEPEESDLLVAVVRRTVASTSTVRLLGAYARRTHTHYTSNAQGVRGCVEGGRQLPPARPASSGSRQELPCAC